LALWKKAHAKDSHSFHIIKEENNIAMAGKWKIIVDIRIDMKDVDESSNQAAMRLQNILDYLKSRNEIEGYELLSVPIEARDSK
jgi:hypothetical protein